MNILVVDDEYYIVQGIKKNVNWDKLGIDNIYIAYSMKQAQEVFQQNAIDILLTDIEMQKGSGLDLITWVNDNGYEPVKLLLTGHQNFTYAQKAITLHCFQYLVKPVETSLLEEELMHAVNKVKENKNLNRAKNIAASWDSNKVLRMETFWREIYTGFPSEKSITEAMERLSVPHSWLKEEFYFLFFSIYPKNIVNDKKMTVPIEDMTAILSRDLGESIDSSFYKISSSEFAFAVLSNKFRDYQDAFNYCEIELEKLSAALTDYRFTIYLSDKTPLSGAAECYQLLKSFESNILTTENIVIPVHSLSASRTHEFSDSQLKDIPLDNWSEFLLQYKSTLILKDIENSVIKDSSYYPVKMLIALYYGVLQTVFSVLESKEISMIEIFPKLIHHTDVVKATSSIENFLFWAEHLLSDAEDILKVNADSDSFVDSVKKYIKANLRSEDLNRNNIAEEFHMNPDYLSYLFHKQSGQLLSTHINNERIHAAKKLLITTDMSLQEIADSTGFSNCSYFHKQFRKIADMTPQQYRTSSSADIQ